MVLLVQPQACGTATIPFLPPPQTALFNESSLSIEPLDLEGLTLEFGNCVCTGIVDSDPQTCSIDARQPSDIVGAAQGWDSIALQLEMLGGARCQSTVGIPPSDFMMREVPGSGTFNPTSVTPDSPDPGWITLHFSPITPGAWTCVEFGTRPDEVCFGSLPGDADGDGGTLASDIPHLRDCVNAPGMCEPHRCDINRSGQCTPGDLLREIDVFNGADPYGRWAGEVLATCPAP